MGIKRKVKGSSNNSFISIGYAYTQFDSENRANGLAPSTIANYKQSFTYFIDFADLTEDSDIVEINKDLITEWKNTMILDGKSIKTINHYVRDVRRFCNWCMSDEREYLAHFTIKEVSGQEPKQKIYTQQEIDNLLAKPRYKEGADFTEWRCWAIANLIYDMGARASTILNIQLQDINFQRRSIYLRHTKNKALSHAIISTQCAKVLKEYIGEYFPHDASGSTYVFCNVAFEQLSYNALAHSFTKYCESRGVEHHSLHGLRHSFATKLAETTNGDMVRVQKALGHSSIDMARKYVDLAAVEMGEYDNISPLATSKERRGRPKRSIKKD